MHILIVSGGYPQIRAPLLGIFAFDQAKALLQFGYHVTFVSIDLRSIRRKRKLGLSKTQKEGVNIINISLPLGKLPFSVLSFFGKKAILKAYNIVENEFGVPDIVHAHFTLMGYIASVLKKKFKLPLVITEHSSAVNTKTPTKSICSLAKKTYCKADKLISVSSKLAENIYCNWGITSSIIHNIVDTNNFIHSAKSENNKFTFLSVGNLNYNKGFDVLIRGFRKAVFKNSVNLIIIGDGPLRKELQLMIDNYNLSDQIKLLGYLSRKNIAKIMNKCRAFVLTSRSETFGVVYIEALAAGLPVIATTCGGPEDFVNSLNGVLIPTDDETELAKALEFLESNINHYNNDEISKNIRKQFSPQTIANNLNILYTELVNSFNE